MRRIVKIYVDIPNSYVDLLPAFVKDAMKNYKEASPLSKVMEVLDIVVQEPKVYGERKRKK